jgi:hypothetical protein
MGERDLAGYNGVIVADSPLSLAKATTPCHPA